MSRRYAVAWLYLGLYSLLAVIYAFLTSRDQEDLAAWSSTNLMNLHHNAAGSLVASAFIPGDPAIAWVALGAAGLFTVNGLLGNVRTVLLLVTGQVAGTLVSEGIVGYKVDHAMLPASARTIVDVGPSYVIVCALVAAILYGSRLQRMAAAVGFAALALHIFRGVTHLDVTAVGHLTAVTTGALLGALLLRSARRAGRARADRSERARADRVDRASADRSERASADRVDCASADRSERASADRVDRASADRSDRARVDSSERASADRSDRASAGTSGYDATVPTTYPIPNATATAVASSANWAADRTRPAGW